MVFQRGPEPRGGIRELDVADFDWYGGSAQPVDQRAILAGVQGNTAANGDQTITVTDTTHFTLNGSSGNGNYVGGTGTCSGGGMAYYDAYTAQAALAALGRSLAAFYTQDDDPTINGSADTNFLAMRLPCSLMLTASQREFAGSMQSRRHLNRTCPARKIQPPQKKCHPARCRSARAIIP